MQKTPHIVVVGGGISGLAAAYRLMQGNDGMQAQVTLLEADTRLGGKIRTDMFAGLPVDAGPDAFLARVPWAVALCRQLGLEKDLIAPAESKTWFWTRRRLRRLPDDLVMGIPTSPFSIARTGILSLSGMLRAGLDLVLPAQLLGSDPTVAQVIGTRLGREVVERLVEPLIGGIFAGRADHLSLAATAPHLAQAAKKQRSLILSLRAQQREQAQKPKKPAPDTPAFYGLPGGLGMLVQRLAKVLQERAVTVRLGAQVEGLTRLADGRYQLVCSDQTSLCADGVILATPAWATATLMQSLAPATAEELAAITYSSAIVVTLGYKPSALAMPLNGVGFLAPRIDRRLLTACTWATSKWPHLSSSGLVIFRCSVGRLGDERGLQLSDEELVQRVHGELEEALRVRSQPVEIRVSRWVRTFPQYDSGHQERVKRIETRLASLPGLALAGAAYHGIGVPACIHDGEQAAQRLLHLFSTP